MILLIGTLGSGLIAASAALLGNWINKRSEERKHRQQLIITAAIESWKHINEILVERDPRSFALAPVDDHILHMMKFAELILDGKIDQSNVEQKLKELSAITAKVNAYREKQFDERNP